MKPRSPPPWPVPPADGGVNSRKFGTSLAPPVSSPRPTGSTPASSPTSPKPSARPRAPCPTRRPATWAPRWRAGFGYEFLERPDGYRGLVDTYGLAFRSPPQVMDLTLSYRALAAGRVDVIAGDATAGLIESLDLFQLEDNRGYFPPYDAVPVARASTLLRYPQMRKALEHLSNRISAEDMRRMNHAADARREKPADIARRFLDRRP